MMNKHLQERELIQLYYEQDSSEYKHLHTHLETCESCRAAYDDLMHTLNLLHHHNEPQPSTNVHHDLFNRAWQSVAPKKQPQLWRLGGTLLRHGFSFAMGLTCGLMLLFSMPEFGNAKSVQKNTPTVESHTPKHIPAFIKGTNSESIYQRLEDPVVVIHNHKDNEKSSETIQGTIENGTIQVIWNL